MLADRGPQALTDWMAANHVTERAGTGWELIELARMQLVGGDPMAARKTMVHADRVLPADLLQPGGWQPGASRRISGALIGARIELTGGGDRARGLQLLGDFERLLDTYEKSGGRHFGLYTLRAETLRGARG